MQRCKADAAAAAPRAAAAGPAALILRGAGWCGVAAALVQAVRTAYWIRLFAISTYGPVIHEFDPWFNYRAAERLAAHGWRRFFTWFDHEAWYPLGRPVATTIYPGMQIVAVAIWRALEIAGQPWSLNDVCCYIPAWFGAGASVATGLLAHEGAFETSGGSGAALAGAALVMAVLPAHAKRSVGGGFDNEAVAVAPMCAAFALWARSLRAAGAPWAAALAGVAYGCMAATWGGYVFALNVIGVHAVALAVLGYDVRKVHRAYSTFYVVGTLFATQVPVISWTPLRSLEQLGPLAVFAGLQFLALWRAVGASPRRRAALHAAAAVAVAAVAALVASGHFAPLSGRVRALLGAHAQRTGNPLVDSVSEHRPSSPGAFWTYLHYAGPASLLGPFALLARRAWPSEAALFLIVLGVASAYFALKMSRLMILMGPSCSALAGVSIGWAFDMSISPLWRTLAGPTRAELNTGALQAFNAWPVRALRLLAAGGACWLAKPYAQDFYDASVNTVQWSLSHPQIVTKDRRGNINDEVREAYWWLRDNTPADARVMAWWDYGYQIAGVANRTTLADGNTWNMEHIGLVGMALTAPLSEGHRIARHLADYVLLWNSDVGKSTHMAKIANSAFPGHCEEATCDQYGIYSTGKPSRMMQESLVWHVCREGLGSAAAAKMYREVHASKHGKVRIVEILHVSQESKAWNADPSNRACDAPGSWYCPGQYPPQLRQLMGWQEPTAGHAEASTHRAEYEHRVARQRSEAPGPNGPDIPPGSYLDSCQGCRMDDNGDALVCARCSFPPHASSAARLPRARSCPNEGRVDNIRGGLECTPMGNEPGIPAGGYRSSCLGCRLEADGARLACSHCSAADGRRRASDIGLDRCQLPARVDNNDGVLVCSGVPNGAGIPAGEYQRSCAGCALIDHGATLRCSHCMTAAREQVEASIALEGCQKFENSDGTLMCVGLPHARDTPIGRYQQTCRGCKVSQGVLACQGCKAADGRWLASSLSLAQCGGNRQVGNRNGRLACE